jgi:hypothetical protein
VGVVIVDGYILHVFTSICETMDCVTMVLIQDRTNISLDLIVLINSYLMYEKITDENFKAAIALWFEDEENCKWRFPLAAGTPRESQI